MKIGLIFPPVFDPSMPYLGPYLLQSYVNKMRPDCDIDVFDLNIKFFNDIIKNPYVNFDFEMDVIDSYFQIVRNEELIKNALLNWSIDKDLTLTRQSIIFNFNRDLSKKVVEYIESKNIFYNSILRLLFTNVNIENYELFGVSITSYEQLIASLIIAKGIKDLDNEKQIVFGGNIISRIWDKLLETNLNKYIDYIVKMEGELPLMNLISYLKGEEISTPTNNLIDTVNKTIIDKTKTPKIVDLNTIPITEFKDVEWDLYYSPISVLPIYLSRGCSWGRCTFCGIYYGWCTRYRTRNITNIVDEIGRYVLELKINSFRLIDESPSLNDLLSFSDEIIKMGLDIRMEAYLNIYKKLMNKTIAETLYNAGFRQFFFGFESIDEKILKEVKKGINIPKNYRPILDNLHKHGISNYGFFIIGLPNDNIDNERRLEEFIIDSKNINTIAISSYIPISNSEMYNDKEYQERHKLVYIPRGDLTTWCDYTINGKYVGKLVKMRTENMVERIFLRRKDLFVSSNIPYEARFFLCNKYGNEFNKNIINSNKNQHISFQISDELNQRSKGPEDFYKNINF